MAVFFDTRRAQALLDAFVQAIEDDRIAGWQRDDAGDFTHKADRWAFRAWMRPSVEKGRLAFHVLCRNDGALTRAEYAYYHAQLIETFLAEFGREFASAEATAEPEPDDVCE